MSRRPNASQALALKAAAAAAAQSDEEMNPETEGEPQPPAQIDGVREGEGGSRPRGRPRGKRPVAARQTVYLDDARHAALARIAEDRGRSIHSLIIEGIDHVIGKPTRPGWE